MLKPKNKILNRIDTAQLTLTPKHKKCQATELVRKYCYNSSHSMQSKRAHKQSSQTTKQQITHTDSKYIGKHWTYRFTSITSASHSAFSLETTIIQRARKHRWACPFERYLLLYLYNEKKRRKSEKTQEETMSSIVQWPVYQHTKINTHTNKINAMHTEGGKNTNDLFRHCMRLNRMKIKEIGPWIQYKWILAYRNPKIARTPSSESLTYITDASTYK